MVDEDQNYHSEDVPTSHDEESMSYAEDPIDEIEIKPTEVQQEKTEEFLLCEQHHNESEEEQENTSPNIGSKRKTSEDLALQKSTKKHASTEMKFRSFKVNWSKISDGLLKRLSDLQNFRDNNPALTVPRSIQLSKSDMSNLCNAVVDQLRLIDTRISACVIEVVAKQIIGKFPCLNFVDDDGYGNGQSFVVWKHKMINRSTYLNRFKDPGVPVPSTSEVKRNRNVRAGTLKEYWEHSSKECAKELMSKLMRDEPSLLTEGFLEQSQSYVRFRFDQGTLKTTLDGLPVLRRRQLLSFHFEKATGVAADSLGTYFAAKRNKLIDYSRSTCKNLHLEDATSDYEILKCLCSLLGENLLDLIEQKEIGTPLLQITTKSPGPAIVAVDIGNGKLMYYVFAEQVRLTEGTERIIIAITDLMCVHYVHNFMYMKCVSKFLEFVQEYFLKILPLTGSKSRATRKNHQQRVVTRIITAIANHNVKELNQ
ncbi:uncharacterized protein LOC135701521 [Ochlerotatus camptorhynchus]|uniref:uncharacterized protein LOC135701521 n=1 Tax=Ochlerotatus camptorhynchus TaxID=644619 RepID=UPI0031CFDF59